MVGEAGRRGGQTVVSLEVDHRPDRHPQRPQCLLEQLELRQQLGWHTGIGLVARVAIVAPGVDDMVGRAAEVADTVLAQQ